MSQTIEARNKALVLEAFDALFNKRDYVKAERCYWSLQDEATRAESKSGLPMFGANFLA